MLKYLNILAIILVPVVAVGGTIVRPYGPSDYAGGAKAVGSKVNSEFATVASFLNGKNIASDNITDLGINTANLNTGAVTKIKQTSNYAITANAGVFTSVANSSTTLQQITNLSTTITTTGKPVLVIMDAASTGSIGGFQTNQSGGASETYMWLIRDASTVGGGFPVNISGGNTYIPCSSFSYVDSPVAGTYTYAVKMSIAYASGSNQSFVKNCKMSVQEL